jgi:hypothetical protein
MSQTQPDAPLFYLGQDNIAIEQLFALGTGLGTAAETRIDAFKNTCETYNKIGPKLNSSPHRHFNEHLAGVLGKQPIESDWN